MTRRSAPSRLPRSLSAVLAPVTAAAAEAGVRVAVVGGVVRDILLRRRRAGRDADLVVEGDAVSLARHLGRSPGVRARVHDRFGTATLETPEGWRIDLARARRETYPRPGALPQVEPASLEEDLARRDFTVHAMALELPPPPARPRFHDPWGGERDLARRRLRILHPRSFVDDPTRALRGVRYANRLGLRLETGTERRLRDAVAHGALDTVSGDRIRRELERTFSEPDAAGAVRLLVELGIAPALQRELAAPAGVLAALRRASRLARRSGEETTWLLPLLVWAGALSEDACRELAARLSLSGAPRRALERWPAARRGGRSNAAGRPGRPGLLSGDERVAAAALLPPGPERREAERALFEAPARLSIRGADLLQAGIPAGPRVGRALAETELALESGRISPGEELAFALESARRADS